ncbi:phospholipase D family member 5 [Cricetulus griseus]
MKELGVIFYNCSCLVLDLQRIFALYSSLKFKSRVPQTWSKRLYGVYDNEKKLQLQLNETKSQAFVSNSPKLFCPKNRSFDIDAIYSVIDDAKQYVYIAVTDYLPISSTSTKRTYWPDLDGKIREALVLRSVKVRLLISFWKETDPLTFNFISSLKAICTEIANCSLKVKFFDLERENACATKEQKNQTFPKLNRNKYMVTDGAAYIGGMGWEGWGREESWPRRKRGAALMLGRGHHPGSRPGPPGPRLLGRSNPADRPCAQLSQKGRPGCDCRCLGAPLERPPPASTSPAGRTPGHRLPPKPSPRRGSRPQPAPPGTALPPDGNVPSQGQPSGRRGRNCRVCCTQDEIEPRPFA